MTRRARTLVTVALLVPLAACSPTTYDDSAAETVPAATSTTLPSGTAAELLPVMLAEVEGLSAKVMANSGDADAATRIEQLWAAIEDEVAADHPDLFGDFEFVVSRCRLAADRNRPADADRALKNLTVLVDAVLG